MVLRFFVKINLRFRIMDPLKWTPLQGILDLPLHLDIYLENKLIWII